MFPTNQFPHSLADRLMNKPFQNTPITLAIALGANLPSPAGQPASTLRAVRPELETVICDWLSTSLGEKIVREKSSTDLRWRWSPLFETEPIGGPSEQATYINAVLVVDGTKLSSLQPSEKGALNLLERFLKIERDFGRERKKSDIRWGPRPLDLDLLGWGGLYVKNEALTLPHPRLFERNFVVVPLGEALNKGGQTPIRLPKNPAWEE